MAESAHDVIGFDPGPHDYSDRCELGADPGESGPEALLGGIDLPRLFEEGLPFRLHGGPLVRAEG